MLSGNFNGIQHIGVPVTNAERSMAFYEKLGFERVMDRPFEYQGMAGRCCMMQRGGAIIELYQMPEFELEGIRRRGDGHIDHVALAVSDIEKAFAELKAAGFEIAEDEPATLAFWENGCSYFTVIGPDGERLEFNQIL